MRDFTAMASWQRLLRGRYADPRIRSISKTDGLTWKVKEILAAVKTKLSSNGEAAKTV